ncbi:ergothioneine biosynthesis protein EgtC [filamentous cyanobacterium LEGE 11480]|uniref:Ergothioneine biosynthesis protein EgtC n=1 Tax=Romeriopsis navalis LEGE 11480 TaxID=2777977 RepID=A0A928Z1E7_9CYAN|nr:ergothioneine biosynthesis protein EgtC [Romeriopsis navalis]MBE9029266.1 ergothioneine biosynthesis protein EgtC [Romeriopsis navalis LEGE 11480]
MCRLLAYLGEPVQLEQLIYDPQHSLIVQSYQPQEMTGGILNADGFGIGWYGADQSQDPYIYRHTLPIWNDANLPDLSRYVRSSCILANVRSATPGISVDLSNCQPFQHRSLMAIHNGYIDRFRKTLLRPIRARLSDETYGSIQGTTDSEHMYGLFLDAYKATQDLSLAFKQMLEVMLELAATHQTDFSANFVISDGSSLIAARFANRDPVPSLYWLQPESATASSILIASEPFFEGNWQPFADRSLLTVSHDLTVETESLEAWFTP